MKPKPFEELLAGATQEPLRLVNQASQTTIEGFVVAFPEGGPSSAYFAYLGDAELFARCSPAVMREVWEALKCANENIIEKDNAPFICALFTETEARLLRRALAALNGEKPENKED